MSDIPRRPETRGSGSDIDTPLTTTNAGYGSDIDTSPATAGYGSTVDPALATADAGYIPAQPDPDLRTGAASGSSTGGKATQVARQSGEAAARAAGDVKDTAMDQAQRVAGEAKAQVRNLAGQVRDRAGEQARVQNDRLVGTIRQAADQLDEMRGDRADSPAATIVSRVADSGRQFADYLDRHGPEGVLNEVQDFARRRPGAFLAAALAAGFVVGRLGKSVSSADSGSGQGKPASDLYESRTGYPSGYPQATVDTPYEAPETTAGSTLYASTGTGAPVTAGYEDAPGTMPPIDRREDLR